MARNQIFDDGYQLSVVCSSPATPSSGDPVRYGQLTGVALTDESEGGNASGYTTVDFGPGVWDVYVFDEATTGVAVGDPIYFDDTTGGDPATHLTNSATGMEGYFGVALEAVGANATTLIQVLHIPVGTSIAIANGAVATGMLAAAAVTSAKLEAPLEHYADVALTSVQVKALKATPITLVAAPGADLAIVPEAIAIVVDYGGTNAFTEDSDDLSVGYAGGAEIKEIESTGLIDQTNDEWRYITFEYAETFVPEENKAVVITNSDDEIAGNAGADNVIHVRLYYKTVPTDAFIA